MSVKNGPIRVATAAEGTAKPSIPAAGTAVTFSGSWTEFATDLDDGDVTITPKRKKVLIEGPADSAPEDVVLYANGIESITFPGYQISSTAFSIDTAMTDSSGTVTAGTSDTKLAVCVEVRGVGFFYFPSCTIEWGPLKGNPRGLANMQYTVTPFQYSGYSRGYDWNISDGS